MKLFVDYLCKNYGWEVVSELTAGPRDRDWWIIDTHQSDVLEVVSYMDGEAVIKTAGGIVVLTDEQIRENASAVKK